jgi:hypothetical protein
MPEASGTTLVRSASVNTEGTEATFTIPANFPKGRFYVLVDIDWVSTYVAEILTIQ